MTYGLAERRYYRWASWGRFYNIKTHAWRKLALGGIIIFGRFRPIKGPELKVIRTCTETPPAPAPINVFWRTQSKVQGGKALPAPAPVSKSCHRPRPIKVLLAGIVNRNRQMRCHNLRHRADSTQDGERRGCHPPPGHLHPTSPWFGAAVNGTWRSASLLVVPVLPMRPSAPARRRAADGARGFGDLGV